MRTELLDNSVEERQCRKCVVLRSVEEYKWTCKSCNLSERTNRTSSNQGVRKVTVVES